MVIVVWLILHAATILRWYDIRKTYLCAHHMVLQRHGDVNMTVAFVVKTTWWLQEIKLDLRLKQWQRSVELLSGCAGCVIESRKPLFLSSPISTSS